MLTIKKGKEVIMLKQELKNKDKQISKLSNELKKITNREQWLEAVLKAIPVGIFLADAEGKIFQTNEIAHEIWGGENKIIPHPDKFADYSEYKGWFVETGELIKAEDWALAKAINKGEVIINELIDIEKFDGTYGTILNSASPVKDSEGNIIGGIVSIKDITERTLIQKELKKHKSQLQQQVAESKTLLQEKTIELEKTYILLTDVLERISDGFFGLDNNWCFTYANKSFLKMYHIEEITIAGKCIWDIFPKLLNTEVFVKCMQAKRDNTPQRNFTKGIYNEAWMEQFFYPSEDGLTVYIRDITELIEFQKEMQRLSNLELIGQMAGGIAHEIRNPLTTIRGFLQLFSEQPTQSENKEVFNLMIEELDRANIIITEFLSIAKDNNKGEFVEVNINQTLKNLYPLLESDTTKCDVQLELKLQKLPTILANEKEIRQIILNLVHNACDAMIIGGKLRITTKFEDSVVTLSVSDEGTGIPQEIIDKLGTPFLTTKEKGTGLGLSICYSIAHRHNAKIEVDSSPKGTTFYVKFNTDN